MRSMSSLSCGLVLLGMLWGCANDRSRPVAPEFEDATPAQAVGGASGDALEIECDRTEFSELPAITSDGAPAPAQTRRLHWGACVLGQHGLTALYLDEVVTTHADGSETATAVGTYTLADGSMLRFHGTAFSPPRSAPAFNTYRTDAIFTGGTGRMAGASGRARGQLFVDFASRTGVLQGDGTLRAD